MTGTRIAAIRLFCADPRATARFYVRAFGCIAEETGEGSGLAIRLGEQRLELAAATVPGDEPAPSNSTAFQHCAIIVADMTEAMARLNAVPGWTAISRNGPEHLPEASGGASAFKFRDPDGHPLELLQFPPEEVPDAWRLRTGGPFLGVDHSAIAVSDADRSIAFYEGLGFHAAERHGNRGLEQARMDGLASPDAVVDVVTLMPDGGAPPHLELLCYREPGMLEEAVPDGSPLATVLCLESRSPDAATAGISTDPNGHRLRFAGR